MLQKALVIFAGVCAVLVLVGYHALGLSLDRELALGLGAVAAAILL